MTTKQILKQLKTWLKDLPYRPVTNSFFTVEDKVIRFNLFTKSHRYGIAAYPSAKGESTYLGCIGNNLTPNEGEDWTRCRDLPDGEFNQSTWDEILRGIVSHELATA